jgi:hypothetical protein
MINSEAWFSAHAATYQTPSNIFLTHYTVYRERRETGKQKSDWCDLVFLETCS